VAAGARVGSWHGVAAVVLTSGDTEVVVIPELGMLVAAFVVDGFDHVARPGGVRAVRAGHTSGVPLLHPWANRLAAWDYEALGRRVDLEPLAVEEVVRDRKTGLPIHGVLPRPWTVLEQDAARVVAELAWGEDPAFPFPHRIQVEASLTERELRIATTLEPRDGEVPVAFGWHPWFTPPDAVRSDYTVELPAMRRIELDDRHLPTGSTEPVDAFAGALPDHALDDAFEELAEGSSFSVTGPTYNQLVVRCQPSARAGIARVSRRCPGRGRSGAGRCPATDRRGGRPRRWRRHSRGCRRARRLAAP